jgi:hypothetical protein
MSLLLLLLLQVLALLHARAAQGSPAVHLCMRLPAACCLSAVCLPGQRMQCFCLPCTCLRMEVNSNMIDSNLQ